ncbi:MAG: DUF2059 domain-containing protein [Opitutaceae bacterium]|jgi:hypothetical protein
MKPLRLIFILLVLGATVCPVGAADAPAGEKKPEFRGVLADGSGKVFGLHVPATEETGWAKVGQTVGGWTLKEYRAADDMLVLVKNGREEVLHLSESVIGTYHKATQADAEALLKAMKFGELIKKGFGKNMERMLKELLASNGLPNPTPEQLAEFQKKIAAIFDPAQWETKMATAMSEVYTQEELKAQTEFYGSEAGQAAFEKMRSGDGQIKGSAEPDALKAFYATPLGQSVKAKQAQVNAQLQKTIGPWMTEVMGNVQKAANEFAKAAGADGRATLSIAPEVRVTTP